MAYHVEKSTGDIVINGFELGIPDDPYEGIGNLVNININSVKKEAGVNFATSAISPPVMAAGAVVSADAGTDYLTYTGAGSLENMMTIVFSVSTIGGVSTGTAYWIKNLNGAGAGTFQLTSDFAQASLVDISGTGTGTFAVAKVGTEPITGSIGGIPKFFTYSPVDNCYFMLDSVGDLWTNEKTTTSGYWTWTGPSGTAVGLNQGCGLAFYEAFDGFSSGHRFVFVFRNQTIDYFNVALQAWTFGWDPADGTSNNTAATLNASTSFHNAYVGQDNVMYWCDGSFLGSIFEKPDGPPQTISFDPTDPTTYTYAFQALALPTLDQAQCLAELGINLLIGGKNNAIYPWNRTSTSFTYPILIAEYNITQIVTVNTNSFIFAGNRGRIYITNGSQAQVYKKIPDYLSGTIEPYFQWGGACSNKNQLYFGFNATTNGGTNLTKYGGVWAIDLDTKALRMANTLSYQTTVYNGYVSALSPIFGSTPPGTGLWIGWTNNANVGGIDTTTVAPYAGGTAVAKAIVVSDYVPIGTFLNPTTNGRVEWKLSVPMVSGESIQLQYRQKLSDAFSDITGGTFSFDSTSGANNYSGMVPSVNFQNSQWVQIQALLISTASSPSYTRLTELRLGK